MNIGQLRHRVTFERASVQNNDFAEPTSTWAELATTWARVEPLAGKERFSAMQVQAEVDYRIVCRFQAALADLATNDRARWNGLVFDIRSVINTEGRNIELQVFAKAHS